MTSIHYKTLARMSLTALLMMTLMVAALPVAPAQAAVAVGTDFGTANVAAGTGVTNWTLSGPYTVTAGSNRLLLAVAHWESNATGDTATVTATYGGRPLTQVQLISAGLRERTWVGYLKESDIVLAANTTLSVTIVSSAAPSAGLIKAAWFTGVDQATPIHDSRSTGTETPPAATHNFGGNLSVARGGRAYYFETTNQNITYTPPVTYTENYDANNVPGGGPDFRATAAFRAIVADGVDNPTITQSGAQRYSLVAVSLKPAGTTIGDGTSPANKTVKGSNTNQAVSSFTLSTSSVGTIDTLTGLVITGTNPSNVAASGVKLWRDNGSTANEWDATDTQVGSGVSFSGATATFSGISVTVTSTATQYLLTYDIAASPTNGATLTGVVSTITATNVITNNDTTDAILTIDSLAPTATSINRADANPTSATTVNWAVSFSEAVTGVGVGDFALVATGGVTGESLTGVTGSGSTYTVTASVSTGGGTLGLNLAASPTISDVVGNALTAGFTGQVYTITAATTTGLVSSGNPSVYGDVVTFTATVDQATATGTVEFYDGAALLGTGTLSAGSPNTATLSLNTLNVAGSPHTITAVYLGDSFYTTSTSSAISQTVNPKTLTVTGIAADDKTYDGTTSATFDTSSAVLVGVVGADTVTLNASGATGTFSDQHVGAGKTVTASGFALSGAEAGNYTLTQPTGLTADITARAITVTAATDSKTYDGTTDSSGVPTITVGSLAAGDTVTWTQTFDDKHVGTGKTLTPAGAVSDGNSGNNYAVTFVTNTTGEIVVRAITVTAATDSKGYDGTTSSAMTPTITSGSLAGSDTAAWTQAFDTKHVGTGKTLTPAGVISDGNSGNNYAVTFVTDTTGVITARAITVTAATDSKTYDGTTDSSGVPTITVGSLAVGDTALWTQTFDDKHVGTSKTLTPAGAVSDGNSGGNYGVTFVTDTTGVITALAITVTADVQTKVYGEADPALTYASVPPLASGDSFTGTLSRVAGETVGAYAINQGTLDAGSNYTLSFNGADLTITTRTIDVEADDAVKFIGDPDPALTYTFTPTLAFTDTFTGALTRDPGEAIGVYTITQGTLSLDSNYTLSYTPGQLNIIPLSSYFITTTVVGQGTITKTPNLPFYTFGEVVTLTATADTGWTFDSWSGDVGGSANPITVTVDAMKSVTATFTINTYTLTVATTGTGSGVVSPTVGAHPYNYGTVVTLTATPNTGSNFAGWSGDSDCTDGSVTVDADKTCTATFTLNTYTLTVATAGNGSGVVSPTVGAHPYDYGTVVTLTATPNTGSNFAGWSGDSDCTDGAVTMDADKTCTATFSLNIHTLTVATVGTGSGVVSPTVGPHPYDFGTVVALTATANSGSTFAGWSGNSDCTDGSVTMDADKSCTATFDLVPLADLVISKSDGLTTTLSGNTITYTVTVTNTGPTAVTGAALTDSVPVSVTNVVWSCTATAGSTCGAGGSGNLVTATFNLLNNGVATYTITGVVAPTAQGVLSNTATVALPVGITDPAPGNNSATDTTLVVPVTVNFQLFLPIIRR